MIELCGNNVLCMLRLNAKIGFFWDQQLQRPNLKVCVNYHKIESVSSTRYALESQSSFEGEV